MGLLKTARRTRASWCVALSLGIASLGLATRPAWARSEPRGYGVNDMLSLEQLGSGFGGGAFAFAPDGKAFAFVLCRSRAASPRQGAALDHRCDIFVQDGPGAAAVNITEGAHDGSGWTAPRWSPDGAHLAMSSTRLGGSLWIWDANTHDLRMLTTRTPAYATWGPARWLDANRLILSARDMEATSYVEQAQTAADAGWRRYMEGVVPSTSNLISGQPVGGSVSEIRSVQLYLLNLDGDIREIGTSELDDWTVAPHGLAYIHPLAYSPAPNDSPAILFAGTSEIGLFSVDQMAATPVDLTGFSVAAVLGPRVVGHSLRWSPMGTDLAFLGRPGRTDNALSLYRVDAGTGRGRSYPLAPIAGVPGVSIQWTADNDLLVYGVPGPAAAGDTSRRDWWRVAANGTTEPLTSRFSTPPRTLLPLPGRHAFAAVIDGDLWRISARAGDAENMTLGLPPITSPCGSSPIWPCDFNEDATFDRVVVSSADNGNTRYWIVDLENGDTSVLLPPSPDAELVDYSPASGSAIFRIDGDQGLRLSRVDAGRPIETLIERNQFLTAIAPNRWQRIEYTSERGQSLVGWLLLPFDYEAGRRYPMVTIPYPDSVMSPDSPLSNSQASGPGTDNFFNLQILAGGGYAVLFPSMPLGGQADDPYLRLTEGVIPAVDRAIELGVADSDRLFLLGQSFGGFATYGLVTQTGRFRAAVAISGFVDLTSMFGTFNGVLRYTDSPHLDVRSSDEIEGQVRMRAPPWRDPERYMRNSAILHADRVETPIMMIHGDMDFVPMEQAEEFFRAMYAQGKRAEFVRYWGEGHRFDSPANVRDMWTNIFRWFAENGGIPVEPVDPAAASSQPN